MRFFSSMLLFLNVKFNKNQLNKTQKVQVEIVLKKLITLSEQNLKHRRKSEE